MSIFSRLLAGPATGPLADPEAYGKALNGGLLGAVGGSKGLLNIGALMLANSGYEGARKPSFGELIGKTYMQSQMMAQEQAARKIREQYMQAQMEQMRKPEPVRTAVIADPITGQPKIVKEEESLGQSPYMEQQQAANGPSEVQIAQVLNDPSTPEPVKRDLRNLLDRKYRDPAGEPLVPVRVGDKTILLPRSQAVGMEPGTQRDSFVPTEGERTAANYHDRMAAAEKRLGNYIPSVTDYAAATTLMSRGPMVGSIANEFLSPKGQLYFQSAADWVRAKLRKESGAVISPEEMAQEIKTYFPVPGDKKETIEQKRQARKQAEMGMRQMSGRAIDERPQYAPIPGAVAPPSPLGDDPLGLGPR